MKSKNLKKVAYETQYKCANDQEFLDYLHQSSYTSHEKVVMLMIAYGYDQDTATGKLKDFEYDKL